MPYNDGAGIAIECILLQCLGFVRTVLRREHMIGRSLQLGIVGVDP